MHTSLDRDILPGYVSAQIGAPPRAILLPYTTLFRSVLPVGGDVPRQDESGVWFPLQHASPLARGSIVPPFVPSAAHPRLRSEEHTSELQSPCDLVCPLLL